MNVKTTGSYFIGPSPPWEVCFPRLGVPLLVCPALGWDVDLRECLGISCPPVTIILAATGGTTSELLTGIVLVLSKKTDKTVTTRGRENVCFRAFVKGWCILCALIELGPKITWSTGGINANPCFRASSLVI